MVSGQRIQDSTPRGQIAGLLAAGLAAINPAWRSAHRNPAPQLRED